MKRLSDVHVCANRPRGFWLALILAGLLGSAGSARASDYKLSIVAKTGDTIDGNTLTFVGPATINNAGTVAFVGGFADNQIGIFRSLDHPCGTDSRLGDHQPDRKLLVKTGDTIDGLTLLDFGTPVLNDRGTIAYIGTYESLVVKSAIFETQESDCVHFQSHVLVKSGDVIAGHTLDGVGSTVTAQPTIDNPGTVFFWAFFDSDTGAGIFTPSAFLASTGERSPATDGHGNVVFRNLTANGDGIFTQSSPLAEPGDIVDGFTLLSFGDGPDVNHRGTVAFFAAFEGQSVSGAGIFTTREVNGRPGADSRLLVRTGDTIDGLTLTGFFNSVAINDSGTVAFNGFFSGGAGVFTQSALVAREGDIVDAKVLGELILRHQDINNAGEIVFETSFSDGSTGIILADPLGNGH